MSDTLTKPEVRLDTGQEPGCFAHIVDQREGSGQDVTYAYVEGTELIALCGLRWVPSRDPKNKPICQDCLAVWEKYIRP